MVLLEEQRKGIGIMDNILFFSHPQIVLQEVPNEISLALSISGCSLKCEGCHSAFTWKKNYGLELTNDVFIELLNKNQHISCVLFYGGEWKENRLLELIAIAKDYNKKVCLYTGLEMNKVSESLKNAVDYLKTGRYIKNRGGLNNKNTNQRFYNMKKNIDITNVFWK